MKRSGMDTYSLKGCDNDNLIYSCEEEIAAINIQTNVIKLLLSQKDFESFLNIILLYF
jgi:hypothetical protein